MLAPLASRTAIVARSGRQPWRDWRRLWAASLIVLLAIATPIGGWAAWLRVTGNIHEIEPGIYRSGQLGAERMAAFVRAHGIKTVINLRGESAGQAWYRDEVSAVQGAGAMHVSVRLSATHIPDRATLKTLIDTLRNTSGPILLHCNGGADRSGLAAALYELVVRQRPAEVATGQLSLWYGHFPWLGKTSAMDQAFATYARGGRLE